MNQRTKSGKKKKKNTEDEGFKNEIEGASESGTGVPAKTPMYVESEDKLEPELIPRGVKRIREDDIIDFTEAGQLAGGSRIPKFGPSEVPFGTVSGPAPKQDKGNGVASEVDRYCQVISEISTKVD